MAKDTVGDPRIDEAKQFLKWCNDADSMNRSEALEDLKFVSGGDQWPVDLQNSRNLESRPVLTINKLDGYCRQVVNQIRQQRPRPKVHGMNSQSDAKVAEVIQGIIRHIEANSNADNAYDTAADYAVRMGWGFIRVRTDYVREDSFEQEIFIDPVDNPFTVYFDINSVLPDGSDAEKCLITAMMSKADFQKMYPDAEIDSFTQRGTGDSQSEWITKEDIRVAEYFYTVRKQSKLILLSDGSSIFEEEFKQQAETQRELMRQTTKAHNTESVLQARVHDVNTKAITSQNKSEIEAISDLLLHHMDTARLEREIQMRNAEQYAAIESADQSIMQKTAQ